MALESNSEHLAKNKPGNPAAAGDDSRSMVKNRLYKIDIDILADLTTGDWELPKAGYVDEHTIEIVVPQIGRAVIKADAKNQNGDVEYYFNSDELDQVSTSYKFTNTDLFAMAEDVRVKIHPEYINYVAGNEVIRTVLRDKVRQQNEEYKALKSAKDDKPSTTDYFKTVVSDFVKTITPEGINKEQFNDPFGIVGYIAELKKSVNFGSPSTDATALAEAVVNLTKERDELLEKNLTAGKCLNEIADYLQLFKEDGVEFIHDPASYLVTMKYHRELMRDNFKDLAEVYQALEVEYRQLLADKYVRKMHTVSRASEARTVIKNALSKPLPGVTDKEDRVDSMDAGLAIALANVFNRRRAAGFVDGKAEAATIASSFSNKAAIAILQSMSIRNVDDLKAIHLTEHHRNVLEDVVKTAEKEMNNG